MKQVNIKTTLVALCGAAILAANANAQLAGWEFNTNSGNEISVAATTLNTDLDPASITRGAGIDPSGLSNAFSASDFTLDGTQANAITNNDYFQVTLSAKVGFVLSLSTLDVNLRRSSTGPNTYIWRYSVGGAFTSIGSPVTVVGNPTSGAAQTPLGLSGISALQNMSAATVATFRLYAYGATATTGTFAVGRLTGNDLAFAGTITAVPEPHEYALGLGALVVLVAYARRRRMAA